MRNKGLFIALTLIVSAFCLYYLSFTFLSHMVEKDAEEFATTKDGKIDKSKEQSYLDSVWTQPAINVLGVDFTYREIKDREVKLGLDLMGGMHVTMEVSAPDIILALANNNQDPALRKAVMDASAQARTSQQPFVDLFYTAFKNDAPGQKLAKHFATKSNRDKITFNSQDQDVLNYLRTEVDATIERSYDILRARIDKFGVSSPNIQRLQGTNRIQIELPGVENPERVRKLLQGAAKLEFYEVWEEREFYPYVNSMIEVLSREEKAGKIGDLGLGGDSTKTDAAPADNGLAALTGDSAQKDTTGALATNDSAKNDTGKATAKVDSTKGSSIFGRIFFQIPGGLASYAKDTAKANRLLARPEIKALFPANMMFAWQQKGSPAQDGQEYFPLYAIKKGRDGKAPLDGTVITNAYQDFDPTNGSEATVSMQMNGSGAQIWKRLTAQNVKERIAIVLDDYVVSAPNVQNEIPNGSSVITGNFTIEEAKDMANILKAGKLPVPSRIVEEEVVGPTLGAESIRQGLLSIAAGFVVILLFMVAYYSTSGLIANMAVLLNVFLILGILVPFDAVLTLPGIAGIVLTIGMAVDANVLINERIKDELRHGHGMAEALSKGYSAASVSIWDANLTTLLAGIVLYFFGSGPVQGFAVTLMIGIATSLFTSIYITRIIAEWRLRKTGTLSVYTGATKDFLKNVNYDFVGKRKIAYIVSSIIIGAGLVSMFTRGFDQGVDFSGGWRYTVQMNQSVSTEKISQTLNPFLNGFPEVKTIGSDGKVQITTNYLIADPAEDAAARVDGQLRKGLGQLGTYEVLSSSKVGPTVAQDIRESAVLATIIAMGLIFLFIWFRFNKWQYALGATIAVVHDTLIILTCYTLFKDILPFALEIDQNFIAALLTIIGYSVNDTVVIFDRVREFFKDSDVQERPETVVNKALNDTFSRTVVTAGTVFLVVLILLLFGGETIRGMSFALLIGVITGTYSTIYLAIPFVVDAFKGRNTEGRTVAKAEA